LTNKKSGVIIVKVNDFTKTEAEVLKMSKDLNYAMLLDFYGELLTEKQRDIMQLYYYEDLSLSEIAENENITRQGVHDAIKHAEQYLDEFESKTGFVEKIKTLRDITEKIKKGAQRIDEYNTKYQCVKSISEQTREIMDYAGQAEELFGQY